MLALVCCSIIRRNYPFTNADKHDQKVHMVQTGSSNELQWGLNYKRFYEMLRNLEDKQYSVCTRTRMTITATNKKGWEKRKRWSAVTRTRNVLPSCQMPAKEGSKPTNMYEVQSKISRTGSIEYELVVVLASATRTQPTFIVNQCASWRGGVSTCFFCYTRIY